MNKNTKWLHTPTGKGQGKWENDFTYALYKVKRNRKNKLAKLARKRNRR